MCAVIPNLKHSVGRRTSKRCWARYESITAITDLFYTTSNTNANYRALHVLNSQHLTYVYPSPNLYRSSSSPETGEYRRSFDNMSNSSG